MTPEGQAVDPLVGTSIGGKYKIVKLLGEGGMGAVYLGEQSLGSSVRKVAIKTLHKHLSMDPQIRARFQREVGTVAELEHPNTIQVYDFGTTDDGHLYIVMEYVQGKSVADTIEQEGPMSSERVIKIMTQVCGSLDEAHGRGIVHRDLKPDNVVLADKAGQKDWVEVLDFGIAKRSSETDPNEAKLTQQGMVLGTPPYMSPEQFTGQPIGPESDIYSLGVMTYEMLTGQLPFRANTAWEWASQHMTAQPSPFEAQPQGDRLPPAMRTAVMRALSKNPADRFHTASEFVEALRGNGAPQPQMAAQPGGAARTEMAMPAAQAMDFAAPAAAPMMMAPAHTPPHGQGGYPQGGAALPPAPQGQGQHQKKKGSPALLIGGLVGALAVVGVIIAVAASGGTKTTGDLIPPPSAVTVASDTTPPPSAAPSADEPPANGGELSALSGAGTTPPSTGGNTGGKVAPKASAKPAASGVPTPHPAGGVSKETQTACDQAKRPGLGAAMVDFFKKKCTAGGGKL